MDVENFDPEDVISDNGNYFGMPFSPEQSALVLISAPWDVTVSFRDGTSYAPDAIIDVSRQLDFYDPAWPESWRKGIATAPIDYSIQDISHHLRPDAERVIANLEDGGSRIADDYYARKLRKINDASAEMNEKILSQARHWLLQGKIVGLVGGDHSTAYGMIRAVGERYDGFGVLQIDAHCDLRPAYEGFEHSHASVMYNVLRDVPQLARLTQVGVREFSRKEWELTREDARVEMFCDHDLSTARAEGATWREQCDRIVATLPHDVYVSLDIDGLSVECCPHTGTPVPGGLSFNEAAYLLERIVDSGRRIVGFDLVEVVPDIDDRIDAAIAARLLFKLCGAALKNCESENII